MLVVCPRIRRQTALGATLLVVEQLRPHFLLLRGLIEVVLAHVYCLRYRKRRNCGMCKHYKVGTSCTLTSSHLGLFCCPQPYRFPDVQRVSRRGGDNWNLVGAG